MQKLEDIISKEGDIIYYSDGDYNIVTYSDGKTAFYIKADKITKIIRPVKYETIYKVLEQILTQKEKEYLENFLRPFKDRVTTINKYRWGESREYIRIWLSFNESISLPLFAKNTMYKGMELNKEYTLEELGLFEE